MKFYTSHQIALHSAIIDHGFDKSDFSFSKKKGRIISNYNHADYTFSFFAKRESKLDVEKMRVLDEFSYELIIDGGDPEMVPSWEVLVEKFNDWLKRIQ